MAVSDIEAWDQYPHHRKWFNKLDLSLRLGHLCGPCGVAPPVSGGYIVRPIYNLEGMGVGASKKLIAAGDSSLVPPGYFWCEWFYGEHLSVTYTWQGEWVVTSSWRGDRLDEMELFRFYRWVRSDQSYKPPPMFDELQDVGVINIEYVDGRVIEVHLRPSPDPEQFDEMYPVWADQEPPPGMIPFFDNAGGFLTVPRIGFVGH